MRPHCLLVVALTAAAVASGTAPSAAADEPSLQPTPGPAARVNGVPIEQSEVHELVKGLARTESSPPDSQRFAELTDAALESLIDLELLYQEAVRSKVELSAAEVDTEVAAVRQHFASDEEFAEALRSRGLTPQELRLETRRTLTAERLLQRGVWRDVRVESREVEDFYEENRAQLQRPLDEVQDSIAQMLLEDKRNDVRAQLIKKLRAKASIQRFPPFAPKSRSREPAPAAAPD